VDFNYQKIKFGNWLYRNCFPAYNLLYAKFKHSTDKAEIDLLKKLVAPGDTILDIGANIGFYARLLSGLTGEKGKVICFEPDSKNFEHLQKNTRDLKNVTIHKKAVSDKAGVLKVYRSKLLNVDHRTYPVNNYDSIEETEAVSIDDLIAQGSFVAPQLIKIDIQGYEMAAFAGMRQLLKSSSGLKIVAEYWPHGFRRAGSSALEFYDLFDSLGYAFSIIGEDGLSALDRSYVEQNNSAPFEFSFNVLIEKK
jgi:FkbM family methyltransferase